MSEQIMDSPERFKGHQHKVVQLTITLKSQSLLNGKNTMAKIITASKQSSNSLTDTMMGKVT